MFGFQKLRVYQFALDFLDQSMYLGTLVAKGHAALGDQLRRAAYSISLNIGEGSGRLDRDQRRFYSTARGSALECAAILDVLERLRFASPDELAKGRSILSSIVAMLTVMIRSRSNPNA